MQTELESIIHTRVQAEREACAKVVEDYLGRDDRHYHQMSALIRERQ